MSRIMRQWLGSPLILVLVGGLLWSGSSSPSGSVAPPPENPGITGGVLEIEDHTDLLAAVFFSDTIVIGEVGPVQARDYPLRHQLRDHSAKEIVDLGGDEYIYSERAAYHLIEVEEVIHGDPADPFILIRPDMSFYENSELPEIAEGERVLVIAHTQYEPEYWTDQFSSLYRTQGYGSVFVLDDSDRAFPLMPSLFQDNHSEAEKAEYEQLLENLDPDGPGLIPPPYVLDLIIDDGDLDPYIHMDDLRGIIEEELEERALSWDEDDDDSTGDAASG